MKFYFDYLRFLSSFGRTPWQLADIGQRRTVSAVETACGVQEVNVDQQDTVDQEVHYEDSQDLMGLCSFKGSVTPGSARPHAASCRIS